MVEFDTVTMSSLSNRDHNWHEYVQVGDCIVHFKLDTGAMASMLPYTLFKKACPEAHLTATPTRLQAFNNSIVKPLLTNYQDCTHPVIYYVTDEVDAAILGQLGCNIFQLVQRIKQVLPDTSKISGDNDPEKQRVLDKHAKLFTGLGEFKDKCTIRTDQAIPPKQQPPRKLPFAKLGKLKETLQELEEKGVIANEDGPTP